MEPASPVCPVGPLAPVVPKAPARESRCFESLHKGNALEIVERNKQVLVVLAW